MRFERHTLQSINFEIPVVEQAEVEVEPVIEQAMKAGVEQFEQVVEVETAERTAESRN